MEVVEITALSKSVPLCPAFVPRSRGTWKLLSPLGLVHVVPPFFATLKKMRHTCNTAVGIKDLSRRVQSSRFNVQGFWQHIEPRTLNLELFLATPVHNSRPGDRDAHQRPAVPGGPTRSRSAVSGGKLPILSKNRSRNSVAYMQRNVNS